VIDARRRALLAWYDRTRRPLPWRDTADPYAVLVSEVMAQQTQVARVIPAYERFLARFPTVESLAAAPLSAVLAAWSGLGYNRRALYLHEAARSVAADGWPETAAGLRQLAGVGPYTSAAVACFAFGQPIAAVDTNARRVLSRWAGSALDPDQLTKAANQELDPDRPADWNQAVMDLGARLCSPRSPDCGNCPVADWCADPAVYAPPPRQSRFAGSVRQARGQVLRRLVEHGSAPLSVLTESLEIDHPRLRAALAALETEGLITQIGTRWAVTDQPASTT
jgi:A/G-specific adenine glycosylase